MKKISVASLSLVLWSAGAFAVDANLLTVWGAGRLVTCQEHDFMLEDAAIGQSEADGWDPQKMYTRGDWTDEFAVQAMVAMKVNNGGAYFCPVQIEGKNKNKGNAWTEYAKIGNGNDCVWLCQYGYTGEQCAEIANSQSETHEVEPLKRENYSTLQRVVSGSNIENQVYMFQRAVNAGCGANKHQEHDMILVITGWLPSGHGAKARQLVVRAQRNGWKDMVSWAAIYPATDSNEITVCLNGYKPNKTGNDCEPINEKIAADANPPTGSGTDSSGANKDKMCADWTGYDTKIHKAIQGKNGCLEYRCKESGYAFASVLDRTCVECNHGLRGGIAPETGVCVTCESGKVFSPVAITSGYCGEAIGLSKTDMQYGRGNTKNTYKDVAYQCWTKTETNAYRECVMNPPEPEVKR